jgi:hypothetical protein
MQNITGFDTIATSGNTAVDIDMHNANVAAGESITIDATSFSTAALAFDGSAETNGTFTITADGTGAHTVTLGNGADTYTSTSSGIDTVTATAGANTISTGSGADVITSGSGVDTVTFGTDDDVDTLITNNLHNVDIVTDFDILKADGATAEDQIDVSVTAAEAMVLGTGDLVLAGNAATSVTAGTTSVVADVTGAYDMAGTATALVLNISGTYASTSDVETALEVGGDRALTANGAFSDDDAFLITYSDGTNAKLALAEVGAAVGNDATFTSGSLRVTELVQMNSITDVTDFIADNFDLIA